MTSGQPRISPVVAHVAPGQGTTFEFEVYGETNRTYWSSEEGMAALVDAVLGEPGAYLDPASRTVVP